MASSVNSKPKYEVFLSCIGEDTCRNFTSNLHSALTRENIAALISDDGGAHDREDGMLSVLFKPFRAIGLDRNKEDRESNLSVHFKAIENSQISVIIFSKDYASSERCLQELEKILQCKESKGQIVVPVFYHIYPITVRSQTGSFSNAFEKHEHKNKPERVDRWRAALKEATNLRGYSVTEERNESDFIRAIVSEVSGKLPLSDIFKKVPQKLPWELIFSSIGFFLEVLSTVFDQLSSQKRPQYTLYAILISWLAMIFTIVDLVLKAQKARVYWDIRKFWFCYPYRRNPEPYFGIFKDNVGLFCGLCQCVATTINYTDVRKPIRLSVWPITFALCVFCSQIRENRQKDANRDK